MDHAGEIPLSKDLERDLREAADNLGANSKLTPATTSCPKFGRWRGLLCVEHISERHERHRDTKADVVNIDLSH